MRCSIAGCNSNPDCKSKHFNKDLKFLRFPTNAQVCKAWVKACSRKKKFNTTNARICTKHFHKDDYERNLQHELLGYTTQSGRVVKVDAIPTLHLSNKNKVVRNDVRRNRLTKRNRHKLVDEIFQANVPSVDVEIINKPEETADVSAVVEVVSSTTRSIRVNTEDHDAQDQAIVNSQLRKEIDILKNERKAFEKIFTSQQIKKLREPDKRPTWTIEDISKAIVLYSASPRAYRLLLKQGYPFPGVSTLTATCKKF